MDTSVEIHLCVTGKNKAYTPYTTKPNLFLFFSLPFFTLLRQISHPVFKTLVSCTGKLSWHGVMNNCMPEWPLFLIYPLPPLYRKKCNKIRSAGSDTHWILILRNTTSCLFPRCQSLTVLAMVTPFLDHTQHSHVIWSDFGFKEVVWIRLQNI